MSCNRDFLRELKKMIKEFMESAEYKPTPAICPKCNSKFYDLDLLIKHHEKNHCEAMMKCQSFADLISKCKKCDCEKLIMIINPTDDFHTEEIK